MPATARRRLRSARRARWSCRPTRARRVRARRRGTTSPRSAAIPASGPADPDRLRGGLRSPTRRARRHAASSTRAAMAVSSDARSLYVANQSAHRGLGARRQRGGREPRRRRPTAAGASASGSPAPPRACAFPRRPAGRRCEDARLPRAGGRVARRAGAAAGKRLRRVVRKRGRVRVKVAARDSRRLMRAVGAAGGGAAPLVRRGAVGAEQLEHLLGVLEAAALAEVDVLLVERHRLVLAPAELAQCLGA